jgi:hypothetical protein
MHLSIGAMGVTGIGRLLVLFFFWLRPVLLRTLLPHKCGARCDGARESKVRGGAT